MRKANQLLDLDVDEVSLVDRPANQRKLLLFKAEEPMKKTDEIVVTLKPNETYTNSTATAVSFTIKTDSAPADAPVTGEGAADKGMKPDMDEEHEDEEMGGKKPPKKSEGSDKADHEDEEHEDISEEQMRALMSQIEALMHEMGKEEEPAPAK